MSHDNSGNQYGDGSLNVGVGDFRGSTVIVSRTDPPTFTPEQLEIKRHLALGGKSIKAGNLSVFGVVTGVVGIVGLYFTLFPPFATPRYASWSTLFYFGFALGMLSILVGTVLRRRRFKHFLFRKYYLEAGAGEQIYLSSFTAKCPWCAAKMNLRNVGPKEGPREDRFVCERNPRQHNVVLDPTILTGIDE